jgi:uncharacterized membrane protein
MAACAAVPGAVQSNQQAQAMSYKIPKLFTCGAVVIGFALVMASAESGLLQAVLMFLIVSLTFILGYSACLLDMKRFGLINNDRDSGKSKRKVNRYGRHW